METMGRWQQVSLPRCSYLFLLKRSRTLVYTGPTCIVLNSSPQENAHLRIYHGAPGHKKRSNA